MITEECRRRPASIGKLNKNHGESLFLHYFWDHDQQLQLSLLPAAAAVKLFVALAPVAPALPLPPMGLCWTPDSAALRSREPSWMF